ncbi:UPF0481 protein isoform X3 [Gossypium australe]|uniref:UPF0481 protein isoform X3 n=1 Tax=Gossypium australe TaxID=47621 RepID=A0A5B6WWL4_9ROSI|nr:UPF0481 protein isoform X3 [Gossypium australe]
MQNQEQGKKNMFDITFDNDTKELKIPTLKVGDSTEREFRNFIWSTNTFICKLINTGKDVELLHKSGITNNLLGNDETVTKMFNKLGDSIYYSPKYFYYKDMADQVNKHCQKKWNIWKAKLKKDYFNTPWLPISFLVALLLLMLTILQTIFPLLSYYQQRQ